MNITFRQVRTVIDAIADTRSDVGHGAARPGALDPEMLLRSKIRWWMAPGHPLATTGNTQFEWVG